MKILLPYSLSLGRRFNDPVIAGGIEKFCHSINDTFDDVHILEIEDDSNIIDNTDKIKQTALKNNCDLIICNWNKGSYVGSKKWSSPVPILFICHGNHAMPSTLQRFFKLKENGHSVFFVSEFQKKYYERFAKRMKTTLADIDGFINSGYLQGEKPKIVEHEYDCCTIGRCDPNEKKPFLLKTLLKETGIKNLVITNSIKDGAPEYNYYLKNKHWDNTLWDLQYKDVMKNLSKSMTFFQTYWEETFGLTTLEALSHGIPVILNTKDNTHAAETIPEKKEHIKKIEKNNKTELIDAINNFRNIDRKEIQDMTWEKHTYNKWKLHFINCVDKAVENFKSKKI